MAVPLFSAVTFVPALVASSSLQMQLISLLAISSLGCTAYVLLSTPTTHETRRETVPTTSGPQMPPRAYIDYFNGGLSLLVGSNALYFEGKKGVDDGFWLLCMLPGGELLYFAVYA